MQVFVTGATGYIGFNVASAFRRAGHEVWGLVRSHEKAQLLLRNEIHAVVGTLQAPGGFLNAARRCSVLIHAAADYQVDTLELDRQTVEALLALGRQGAQPKTLIYTSGVWVYGDTHGERVNETTPPRPAKLVARRPATEERVLTATGIRGLVVRPGCVYGRQGGLTAMWFRGAAKDRALMAVGSGDNRWAMVHVDDLSDGYLRLGESSLAGEVFNLVDRSRLSVRDMVSAVAEASGYTGETQFIPAAEAAHTLGDFAECLALDQHVDARKAERLLGWVPKHGSFVDEVTTYYASWQATQPG